MFLIFAKAGVFDVPANIPLVKIMLVKVTISAFFIFKFTIPPLKVCANYNIMKEK